jgi:hypothetical protein
MPDFFYACEIHLKDAKFATPKTELQEEALKKRQEQINEEIEVLKKRWADRQKQRDKDKKKADDKNDDSGEKAEIKEHDKKVNQLEQEKLQVQESLDKDQRIFILNDSVFRLRIGKYRTSQQAKRTAEMLQKPNLFPSVPKHVPDSPQQGQGSGSGATDDGAGDTST